MGTIPIPDTQFYHHSTQPFAYLTKKHYLCTLPHNFNDMATIHFTKMHGLGNDYIYIDCTQPPFVTGCNDYLDPTQLHWTQLAQQWSLRHTGIGADGIVLILPAQDADFQMRIFNADGSEAQMCGNATRCIGKYLYDRQRTRKTTITLLTQAGIKTLRLSLQNNQVQSVQVNMGKPISIRNLHLPILGQNVYMTAVNIGNPHAVIFCESFTDVTVQKYGPVIERHPAFFERTNVEFATIINRQEINMRVWERGSGETMACGTGACATAIAAIHQQFTDRQLTVHQQGGDINIQLTDDDDILMTGPATFVFDGDIEL